MKMPLTAEDIIVGILFYIQEHDNSKITADRETLHRAFYNLRDRFPMLSILSFREREQFPESDQLDQALSNLDATGILSRQNLTPRYYRFEDTLSPSYNNFSKKILTENGIDEKEIDTMAKELEEIVV